MTAPLPTVRVRLFASLRDAAGTAATTVGAATVADAVGALSGRYGEVFAARAATSKVAVGDDVEAPTSTRALTEGDEIVLLPPFSGGA